jgi:hypothetical protein
MSSISRRSNSTRWCADSGGHAGGPVLVLCAMFIPSVACVAPRDAAPAPALPADAGVPDLAALVPGPDALGPEAIPADGPAAERRPEMLSPMPPMPCAQPPVNYQLMCGCHGLGTILCSGVCSEPDDRCIPTGARFLLGNRARGDGAEALRNFGGFPEDQTIMTPAEGSPGQTWSIVPLGGNLYRLTNDLLGPNQSLAVRPSLALIMDGSDDRRADEQWEVRAVADGYVRIANQGRSLEAEPNGNVTVAPGRSDPAQYWKLTRRP